MYLRYPVRNFRCPFCGAKMRTEEIRAFQPWVCLDCSRELQFSKAHLCVLQMVFWLVALLILYYLDFHGWRLLVGTILLGGGLAFVLAGPLDRILPPALEPYELPPWKQPKQPRLVTLFPEKEISFENPKPPSQVAEPPSKQS